MYQADLDRFKENYLIDDEALPLMAGLHDTYGEEFLCDCLGDENTLHTLEKMKNIEREMQEKFISSVCSTNEILEKKLRIDELFPNLYLIFSYEDLIQTLCSNDWIIEYSIMNARKPNHWFISRKKAIFVKGEKWDKCPETIKKHFLRVKSQA